MQHTCVIFRPSLHFFLRSNSLFHSVSSSVDIKLCGVRLKIWPLGGVFRFSSFNLVLIAVVVLQFLVSLTSEDFICLSVSMITFRSRRDFISFVVVSKRDLLKLEDFSIFARSSCITLRCSRDFSNKEPFTNFEESKYPKKRINFIWNNLVASH